MTQAICIEKLGKAYKLGQIGRGTLYEDLNQWWAKIRGRPEAHLRVGEECNINRHGELVWALKDVSLTVEQGEVVGIIGRNGAGKSTLLKILSRITAPTEGQASIRGRISSLLEIGTGFHPELTGRENIYLNGAILGMKRTEITRKYDEIVAFAEVEKYVDTPVKRYSSGMYVRLAFAVAAHLEPEILIIDEVLAVGDAEFQKKCLGKMENVGREGRTVLFVSHNMQSMLRICKRLVLLDSGCLLSDGLANDVVRKYLHQETGCSAVRVWSNIDHAPGNSIARLSAVRVRNDMGIVGDMVEITEPVFVEVEYWRMESGMATNAVIHLVNEQGITLFSTADFSVSGGKGKGRVRAVCRIPGNFLAEGRVYILAAVVTYNPNHVHVCERDAVSFQVVDRSNGEGVRGEYAGANWPGVVRPQLEWDTAIEDAL